VRELRHERPPRQVRLLLFLAADYLVHALVAEPERARDLPHRRAGGVQLANRVVEVGAGDVERVLRVEHPQPGLVGFRATRFVERHSV
jgi:hypothetical protein